MNSPRTRLYRDKIEGKFLGVCAGIGDYVGLDPVWVRLGFLLSLVLSGGVTFFLYLAIGLVAKKKPAHLYSDPQEKQFWQGVRQSPHRSARDIRNRFKDVDRRLARVEEHHVTGNRALSAEIESLR